MRGIKWDLLPQLKEDARSSRELGRGWNFSAWEVFVDFFFFSPLTLGKSSCLLVPGEWNQHRGTLLLQVEVLVLNICDQNRVGSVPFQLWDLGCILLNAIFNQGLL